MFISDHSNSKANDVAEDNLVKVELCGMCGCRKLHRILNYSNTPYIDFIKCENCGAITYDKILKQESIDNLYSSLDQYYKDDISVEECSESGGITFYGSKRFAEHLLKYYKPCKTDNLKILDFGGGDGELAYAVAVELYERYNYKRIDVVVVDYTEELHKSQCSSIVMKHTFPLSSLCDKNIVQENIANQYDIIIASGVVEHIPAPGDDIKRLFELLSNDGIIYFRTPYIYPLRKDLKKFGIEYDTLYPAHIWDLGGHWWDELPKHVHYSNDDIELISSRPSIVEKTFKTHFFIALASHILKAPWFLCHKWPYVGGWEAVYKKG